MARWQVTQFDTTIKFIIFQRFYTKTIRVGRSKIVRYAY